MIESLKQSYLGHKELISYTLTNYVDKLLAFTLPIIVLHLTKNQSVYNDIEYIFSVANLLVVFIDFGLRNYLFYGYSKTEENNREEFVNKKLNYFRIILFFYGVLLIFAVLIFSLFDYSSLLLFFIGVRVLYLYTIGFFNSYYRLIDKAIYLFKFTIPTSVATITFLLFSLYVNGSTLTYFFLAPILLVLGVLLSALYDGIYIDFTSIRTFFMSSLKYSWPILINVGLVSYLNNFGKIYAYNFLSENDMYQLSYLLRISLIVQMAHSSLVAFYSKKIYTDKSNDLDKKILLTYSISLIFAIIIFFLFLLGFNLTNFVEPIKFNISVILVVVHVLLWCYRSYFEIYFGKYNKNKWILSFSMFSVGLFTGYLYFFEIESIFQLLLAMSISSFVNFILVLGFFFIVIKS